MNTDSTVTWPFPDLQKRRRTPEIMDDPSLEERHHIDALKGLERINRLSLTARAFWRALSESNSQGPVRVLDVACGGGDIVLQLASLSNKAERSFRFDGCDISPRAVRYAAERGSRQGSECRFFSLDVVRDPLPRDYDFLISSLFLHHLQEEQVIQLLARMAAASRLGLLISDLRRTTPGYLLAQLAGRVFTRSGVVHHDGPESVRAAFSVEEMRSLAEKAGLKAFSLVSRWPERFFLRWEKEGPA